MLREVEDQVVMPFVVGRAVELHPVVTIFAVLAGGTIAGPIGMLLAVPAAAAVKVILDFLYPTDPDQALAQALPGIELAEQESAARGEEPAHAEGAAALSRSPERSEGATSGERPAPSKAEPSR